MMFKSNVPRRIKVEAVYHLTANLSYPLMVVMSALLLPAMICRFYQGWFQMLLIDVPLFTASTFSIAVFYLMSERELFPKDLDEDLSLSALPHGAGHRPHRHQHQGGDGGAVRHQERLRAHAQIPRRQEGRKIAGRQVPQAPGAGALDRDAPRLPTSSLAILYTFSNHNYFTAPFLILFVIGYWYTGLMSLLQGRFERWRTGANTDESSPKPFPVGV